MHKTTERFWKCFYKLPREIQRISKEQFNLLKINPHHSSLHFKKVGKFGSVRILLEYRVLAVKDGNDFIWVWIGSHDEYERMIKVLG